jgi:hypothetical protein
VIVCFVVLDNSLVVLVFTASLDNFNVFFVTFEDTECFSFADTPTCVEAASTPTENTPTLKTKIIIHSKTLKYLLIISPPLDLFASLLKA